MTAWLACMPTRLLIDLSAECLAKLIGKQQHYLSTVTVTELWQLA
jgi:hypothetical protein